MLTKYGQDKGNRYSESVVEAWEKLRVNNWAFPQALNNPIFFTRRGLEFSVGNIYIIRGSRQVGKTTYIKYLIKELINEGVDPRRILYLSLDALTSRRELRPAIDYFLSVNRDADKLYIFLDEITSLRKWSLELKDISDMGILNKTLIVATGTNSLKLKREIELLPGRGVEENFFI